MPTSPDPARAAAEQLADACLETAFRHGDRVVGFERTRLVEVISRHYAPLVEEVEKLAPCVDCGEPLYNGGPDTYCAACYLVVKGQRDVVVEERDRLREAISGKSANQNDAEDCEACGVFDSHPCPVHAQMVERALVSRATALEAERDRWRMACNSKASHDRIADLEARLAAVDRLMEQLERIHLCFRKSCDLCHAVATYCSLQPESPTEPAEE